MKTIVLYRKNQWNHNLAISKLFGTKEPQKKNK